MSGSVYVSTADTWKGFPVLDHPEETTLGWHPPIMQGWNLLINQRSQGEVDRVRVHITPHTVLSEKCCTWPRSYLTHIDHLTSVRNCVMLGYPEVWDRGGGAHYPLNTLKPIYVWSAWDMKAKMGLWFRWINRAEIALCWGTQRHGVAAWGEVRLFGVLGYWETLITL